MEIPEKIMEILSNITSVKLNGTEFTHSFEVSVCGGQITRLILHQLLLIPFFSGLYSLMHTNEIQLVFRKEMEVYGQIFKLEDYGG